VPRKQKTQARQAREFGVVLAIMGLLFAAGFYFLGHHTIRAYVAIGVSVTSLTLTFLAFPLWMAFFKRWMIFAEFMGMVMSTVILTLFFYFFFSPICLVMRLSGKKMLDLSWRDGRKTYWIDKTQTPNTLERYQRQF
jgi:hypothetical protein